MMSLSIGSATEGKVLTQALQFVQTILNLICFAECPETLGTKFCHLLLNVIDTHTVAP